jgi:hypothetical protein
MKSPEAPNGTIVINPPVPPVRIEKALSFQAKK